MLDIFNNREIALGIWILIAVVLGAFYRTLRDGVSAIIRILFRRYLYVPLALTFLYIAAMVMALAWLGLWDVNQLKNTVLWSLGIGLLSVLRINEISEEKKYFTNSVKDQFRLVTVFEFIVLFYTFSLWAELIIIPFATMLVALQAFIQEKPELKPLSKLVNGTLFWLGVGLVGFTVYRLLVDFESFWQASTMRTFALPIVLSLGFLPFLYGLMTYLRYQRDFISLNHAFNDDALRRSAKRISLTHFLGRPQLLRRWIRDIHTQRPATREEVLAIVRRVRSVAKKENNPPPVDASQGWCPFRAGKFLSEAGLETGDYHPDVLGEGWVASSQYLRVGEGVLASNISYYVSGDEAVAKELKLAAHFNKPEEIKNMRVKFADVAMILCEKACGSMEVADFELLVRSLEPFDIKRGGRRINFTRDNWANGKGFDVRLFIRTDAPLQNALDDLPNR